MAKKRGKTKLFDKGGTIPELKKRCRKETGLDAPAQPVFQTWFRDAEPAAAKKKKKAKAKSKVKAKAKAKRKSAKAA